MTTSCWLVMETGLSHKLTCRCHPTLPSSLRVLGWWVKRKCGNTNLLFWSLVPVLRKIAEHTARAHAKPLILEMVDACWQLQLLSQATSQKLSNSLSRLTPPLRWLVPDLQSIHQLELLLCSRSCARPDMR